MDVEPLWQEEDSLVSGPKIKSAENLCEEERTDAFGHIVVSSGENLATGDDTRKIFIAESSAIAKSRELEAKKQELMERAFALRQVASRLQRR